MDNFMKRAIELAKKGIGHTSPNPCVGCVIVKDGEIVSEGWHRKAGTDHAEVLAIKNLRVPAEKCTLYVTLEPCSHYGRTGPCSEAILKAGFKKVVVGMLDPNPLVNGKGVKFLKENGVIVDVVGGEEFAEFNQPFIKGVCTGLPYFVMKAGMSLDGKIALENGSSKWITSEDARDDGRIERSKCDAVIVGYNTVKNDNPTLKAYGEYEHKDLVKIIVGRKDEFDRNLHIFKDSRVVCIEFDGLNEDFFRKLYKEGIQSIYVEGGSRLHGAMQRYIDKVILYYAPMIIGEGLSVMSGISYQDLDSIKKLQKINVENIGDNIKVSGFFNFYLN